MNRSLDVLLLILFATTICFLDRAAIAYAALPIQQEYGLTDVDLGLIGSGFGIGYLAVVGAAGFFVDRYGSFRVWAIASVLWSLVIMATALAQGFYSFFALRVLLGVAESANFPCLIKTIFDWLGPTTRGRSLAIAFLGIPLSSIIGGPFASSLITTFGWRAMFVILGLFGLVWSVCWLVLISRKGHIPTARNLAAHWKGVGAILKSLSSSKPYFFLLALAFVFDFNLQFYLTWFPYYLETVFGVTIENAGIVAAIPWLFALAALALGGWLTDALYRNTHSLRVSRAYLASKGFFSGSICVFLLLVFPTFNAHIALFSIALATLFFAAVPVFLTNIDLFPESGSSAVGLFIVFGAIAQFLSPAIVGILRQASGGFQSSLALIGAISAVGGVICLFFLKPKPVI